MQLNTKIASVSLAATLLLASAGCGGNRDVPVASAPAPPPAPVKTTTPPPKLAPAAPTIASFTVEPASMERGQSATLRWSVENATEIAIDQGLGAVQAAGSRQVFPSASTTYTLTARSEGGTDSRSVTVEVVIPPPPPKPPPPKVTISSAELLAQEGVDVYFGYDLSELDPEARRNLDANAALLQRIFASDPSFNVVIEGHCDERGSAEYNLGLGDRRATATQEYLIQRGVPANRIRTISYGKERPVCTEANEACYQRNRRAHLAPAN